MRREMTTAAPAEAAFDDTNAPDDLVAD